MLIRINIDVADPDDFCTSTDSMLRNRRRNFHLFLESDHPFSFLTSREIFIVKEDLPLVLLKLYRNNIIIIFASKRFTLTCSTWHMKHKSQFISNKSTSGPLDWELNEEGLHIFLVYSRARGDEKGGTFFIWMAIASSSQEDSSILETAVFTCKYFITSHVYINSIM